MITFNNKAAKEHYLDILVSLVNVHNLKLKKKQLKTKHKKGKQKKIQIFMCNSYTKFYTTTFQ